MHAFAALPYALPVLMGAMLPIILTALFFELVLKGFGLWYAARAGQKWWFIVMLVVNTLGILPLIYLIWFRTDTHTPARESSTPAA